MGIFDQNFSYDILFSLNKGQQGYVLAACKDGLVSDGAGGCVEAPAFISLFGDSSSVSGDSGGSFCISRDNFDSAVFDILLEFDNFQECEGSKDEEVGYCCKVNHTFTLFGISPGTEEEFWGSYGITNDMVWPAGPDQKCLDGRDCQIYLDSALGVMTRVQFEARRVLGEYPKAFTQEQLDGHYDLADLTFVPLGMTRDLWLIYKDLNPDEICPFVPTLRPVVSGSSSSSSVSSPELSSSSSSSVSSSGYSASSSSSVSSSGYSASSSSSVSSPELSSSSSSSVSSSGLSSSSSASGSSSSSDPYAYLDSSLLTVLGAFDEDPSLYYGEDAANGWVILSDRELVFRYESLGFGGLPLSGNVFIDGVAVATIVYPPEYEGRDFCAIYLGVFYCGVISENGMNL